MLEITSLSTTKTAEFTQNILMNFEIGREKQNDFEDNNTVRLTFFFLSSAFKLSVYKSQ